MNKLQQLIEAAKVATPGPWSYAFPYVRTDRTGWKVANVASTMGDATLEAANAKFITLANPATILELCALLEKAEEALDGCLARLYGEFYPNHPETLEVDEALAAIKQWKERT